MSTFVGSITWRNQAPFDRRDTAALVTHRSQLPGATHDTLLLAVSRSGFEGAGVDVQLGTADILEAFR